MIDIAGTIFLIASGAAILIIAVVFAIVIIRDS